MSQCPIQKNLVDASLLSPKERSWLNAYHAEVSEKLTPFLLGDKRALEWLTENALHYDDVNGSPHACGARQHAGYQSRSWMYVRTCSGWVMATAFVSASFFTYTAPRHWVTSAE